MNIAILANYADVIGGIAVLASLVYVGVQIRNNTRSSQSHTNQLAHDSMATITLAIGSDPTLSSLVQRGLSNFKGLSEEERYQFVMLLTSVFRRFENIFYQHRKGLLEEELWQGYSRTLTLYFHSEGGYGFWKARSNSFSPKFCEFLESSDSTKIEMELAEL